MIAALLALLPQAGLEPDLLDDLAADLEELAGGLSIPGFSAAVVHRREVAWAEGFGYANLETEELATPETRYRVASVSKPFAATLVLMLVEEGRLELDAPMEDFALRTWFAPDPRRYEEAPILLRHVLNHTSEGEPGERHAYNGNVYSDVTWVLEDVTRVSYPRLLEERVLAPLGMEHTTPGHTAAGSPELVPLAQAYRLQGGGNVPVPYRIMDPDPRLDRSLFDPVVDMPAEEVAARRALLGDGFTHLNALNTASGLVTTVLDLARFDVALDEGRLLGPDARALMFTPAVNSAGERLPYALGWFVEDVEGVEVAWHYGWIPPAVSALYVRVPERELTFLLLANCDRLSAGMPWTAEGVRASPFARAFLDRLVLGD